MPRHHTPAVINELRGNPSRKKRKEPKAIEGAPLCPEHLNGDPIALAKWDELTNILSEMQLLTASDADVIEQYSIAYSRWRKALVDIQENGDVTISKKTGYKHVSPYSSIINQTQEQMRKLLLMMGLSPSARAGMAQPIKKTKDKWDKFKVA